MVKPARDMYAAKSPTRTVKKTCDKCGEAGYYRPRDRRCKRRAFGVGSYACWGNLTPVVRARKATEPASGDAIRAALDAARLVPEESAAAAEKVRADARVKLEQAQAKVAALIAKVRRQTTLLTKYQARAGYYARRAAMTNEEVHKDRQRREARAAKGEPS